MTKPRLLVAADSFVPRWDGIARVLLELLPFLTETFDVRLAFPDYPGPRQDLPGVEYLPFPLYPLRTSKIGWPRPPGERLQKEVRQADVVWTHTALTIGGTCISEAVKAGVPLLSMIHSVEWEVYGQNVWFGKTLAERSWLRTARARYNQVHKILTPSQTTRTALIENGFSAPIFITPLGVSLRQFRPLATEEKAQQRTHLGLPPNLPVVGYVGRFSNEKDLKTLLRAHQSTQTTCPSHLVLTGGHPGELPRRFLTPQVTVVPPTSEPELYYQVMDLYVLPSLTESFPLGILEAMACGVPPLSTPVGATPDYLVEDQNGFFFPRGDAEALAKQLTRLLSDPKKRAQAGQKARQTVEEGFSWEQAAARIEAHLKEVC